jgi:hypothetical protein
MALSEHVKKLAADAVAGKESTEWIRLHVGKSASQLLSRYSESDDSERAKKLANKAVAQSDAMREIRLVSVNKIDAPLPTPTGGLRPVAENARMEYLWRGSGTAATRDERERDDGR